MTPRSRNILYLTNRVGTNVTERLVGIRKAAASLSAHVDHVTRPEIPAGSALRELIDFWNAAVCIVECAGENSFPAPRLFGKTPVLYVDCDPDRLPVSASCLSCAGRKTADLAARALLRTDAVSFAYIGTSSDFYWSRSRAERFEEVMRLNGKTVTHLRSSRDKLVVRIDGIRSLARAFGKLPRPIGVFAANDFIAEEVISAATLANLEIPGDLSVVGVDDNAEICEHTEPTLTSIRLDFRASGEKAVEMAVRLLGKRRRHALRDTYDALGLVPRGSCPAVQAGGHTLFAARNYISNHLGEKISVSDVVRTMNCSRRTAEMRFRAVCGHSILDEIRAQRCERAHILETLRPELSQTQIARGVGYTGRSALWKLRRILSGQQLTNHIAPLGNRSHCGLQPTSHYLFAPTSNRHFISRQTFQTPARRPSGCPHGGSSSPRAACR